MWLFFKNLSFCVLFTIGVGLIVWHSFRLHNQGQQAHRIADFSAGACTLLTLFISLRLILLHFSHWVSPKQQKYAVRIIAIVPIYAVESYLALRYRQFSLYIETVRESYEAYAIYSFLYYLISLLGEETELLRILRTKVSRGTHFQPWPLNLFSSWTSAHDILSRSKLGVLQYVAVKNICALVVFLLASLHAYDEGQFDLRGGYLYICLVSSWSQMVALYCLVLFYFAMKDELAPWKPVGKFAIVKIVVFATWYQSIAVSYLARNTKLISRNKGHSKWTDEEIAKGIQDYAICIEMLFASIAFSYFFSHRDYHFTGKGGLASMKNSHSRDIHDPAEDTALAGTEEDDLFQEKRPFLSALFQTSVPSDFLHEVRHTVWRSRTPLSPKLEKEELLED